eukprot:scaffold2299_cov131-Cylindrotheca_fusiformis.AAC.10
MQGLSTSDYMQGLSTSGYMQELYRWNAGSGAPVLHFVRGIGGVSEHVWVVSRRLRLNFALN